ncbi:MAG: adhesin [Methanobrevibacter sp.]|nr:adhesin [Methanobrevibacter sp.]
MRLRRIIILVIVLLTILLGLLVFNIFINANNEDSHNNVNNDSDSNIIDTIFNGFNTVNLGSNNKGTVDLIGPIGNKNSNVKIAYIIGVHPLESNVHNALYDSLKVKSDSLNYSYYIYKITVTDSPDDYNVGRMNGQLLANEFVVPDATSKNYNLVIDIHSNQGTQGGNYDETNFIFAPLNDYKSKVLADEIIAKIPPLLYYYPMSQTSPNYVTVPIMQSGTPTLIYETYMYESSEITLDYINKLINTIDNLKL